MMSRVLAYPRFLFAKKTENHGKDNNDNTGGSTS